jgi:hypothetical protein
VIGALAGRPAPLSALVDLGSKVADPAFGFMTLDW